MSKFKPKPHLSEAQLHHIIAHWLELALPKEAVWFHVPNGGLRSKSEAARFKRMGLKPGIPDLCIIYRGFTHFIELKSETGRLSDEQKDMLGRLENAGCITAVCRSLDDAQKLVGHQWKIPLRATV